MSVIEDLVLAFQTRGTHEASAETERVAGSVKKADQAAKGAALSHTKLGSVFSNIKSQVTGAIGMAGFGGLVFTLGAAVKGAEKLQEVQAQLGSAIHANVRRPAKDATEQMTSFADSLSVKGGYTPTESIQGMTQLVRVTHDSAKAEKDMTLATNISRGAHVDLGRAVRAVTMLEQGRATGLSKLGIVVPKVTTAVDQLHATYKKATPEQLAAAKAADALSTKQQAMAAVTKQYSGAMGTYSKTAAGGITNLRNTVEILSVKLGSVLLPIISKVAQIITKFVDQMMRGTGFGGQFVKVLKEVASVLGDIYGWVKKNKDWLEFVAAAILGIVVALKVAKAATDAWKTAQLLFDAAADANPYVIVIGAIIAILVLAYIKFKWFRDFVQGAMHAVVDAFKWVIQAAKDVLHWIEQNWPILVGVLLGPFAFLAAEIIKHWSSVKRGATDVINWIIREFNRLIDFISSLPGKVAKLLTHLWDGLLSGLKDMPKKVLGALEKIPVVGSAVKAGAGVASSLVHGVGAGLSAIGLQGGGPVTQTGTYMVGERGPELVTLPRGSYVTPNDQVGGQQQEHTIIIYNMLDGKQMSKSVIRQGLLQQSRGG